MERHRWSTTKSNDNFLSSSAISRSADVMPPQSWMSENTWSPPQMRQLCCNQPAPYRDFYTNTTSQRNSPKLQAYYTASYSNSLPLLLRDTILCNLSLRIARRMAPCIYALEVPPETEPTRRCHATEPQHIHPPQNAYASLRCAVKHTTSAFARE